MTSAIPDAPATSNPLERHLWYADRLREAGVPFNPTEDIDTLSAIYHSHYDGAYTPEIPVVNARPELQLERALDGATFILNEPDTIPAAWGHTDQVLWA